MTEALTMAVLSRRPHPHLLQLIAVACDVSFGVSMVTPIASFGSMLDLVDSLDFEGLALRPAHVAVALMQVSQALLHLHAQGFAHGDIAPRNVLVFGFDPRACCHTRVKLGDFGEACRVLPGRAAPETVGALARELLALVPR